MEEIRDEIERIKKELKAGNTNKAIQILSDISSSLNDELKKKVILLSSRFEKVKMDHQNGLMTNHEAETNYLRINAQILDLLSGVEQGNSKQKEKKTTSWWRNRKRDSLNKEIIIPWIGILILIAFYLVYGIPSEKGFHCDNIACSSCEECYFLSCFDVALDCFDAQRELTDKEQFLRGECQIVTKAEKLFTKLDFNGALRFYESLTDSFAIEHTSCQREFCSSMITMDKLESMGRDIKAKEVLLESRNLCSNIPMEVQNAVSESLERLEQKIKNKQQWEGVWLQYKSGKDGEIEGEIVFDFDLISISGSFINIFESGIIQRGELFDLKFQDSSLSGKWVNLDTGLSGTFYFSMTDDKDTFEGFYTIQDGAGKYYWHGKRSVK